MIRRGLEVVAIVACYLALRELLGELDSQLWLAWPGHLDWAGLPFYGMWTIVLVVVAVAWPSTGRPRLIPARSAWTRRTTLAVAAVVIGTEWIYGFKVTRIVIGDLSLHAPINAAFLISAAVAAPLVEEWLFRGVLWEAIRARLGTPTAFILTSVLIGIWHWASLFRPSWYGAGGTMLHIHIAFGMLMGLARWRLGAIGVGVALHGLYNGLFALTG